MIAAPSEAPVHSADVGRRLGRKEGWETSSKAEREKEAGGQQKKGRAALTSHQQGW